MKISKSASMRRVTCSILDYGYHLEKLRKQFAKINNKKVIAEINVKNIKTRV